MLCLFALFLSASSGMAQGFAQSLEASNQAYPARAGQEASSWGLGVVVPEGAKMTGGGVQYSFEALGSKDTAEQAFRMLRAGGTATIIGMVPFGVKIELHGYDFLRDRKIQGTSMGGNRFRVDMPRLLSLWRQGRLKLDHLISGRLKLSEINEGFAALKTGAPVRQVIDFAA
jgi:S-(hydroxymethyl)glutathione dehydrogenase/alcohol dehydrogenase